jgi:hypothetical protein
LAISQLRSVRRALVALIVLATAHVSHAQIQEKRLMDRLLEPNMSLQNDAQGRQFTAPSSVETKRAPTKFFFFSKRPREKQYTNVRQVHEKEFATERSRLRDQRANTSTRNRLGYAGTTYATNGYETQAATGTNRTVDTFDYAGNKAFTGRGKSQKSLDAERRPSMTIDEVRELLNKNK